VAGGVARHVDDLEAQAEHLDAHRRPQRDERLGMDSRAGP
jgi:hypothetical protein